jgi:putative ABC transport system substrate-binding protein
MRFNHLRRRDFIALLGGAAAACPIGARAQQPAMPVVGWLSSRASGESADVVAAFRQGLKKAGYVEGQNVVLEFRWGEGQYDRLRAYAAELVRRPVTVMFTGGGDPAAQAAKAATATNPIGVLVNPSSRDNLTELQDVACGAVARAETHRPECRH